MANTVLTNAGLWVAQYALSGTANSLALGMSSALQENTPLSATAVSRIGGLQVIAFQAEGYWDDAADAVLEARLGMSNVPVTIAPVGSAVGDRSFVARVATADYQPLGGAVGELSMFSVGGEGSGVPVGRGSLLHNATRTSTANAPAGVQLGALSSTQTLFAALHVTAVSGSTPTLVVKVQSDDNSGFTSPTDRITFATANATDNLAQFASVAGAVTDDYWRVVWTITGSNPSFSFVVSAGIG
jgi:hypothetical protein